MLNKKSVGEGRIHFKVADLIGLVHFLWQSWNKVGNIGHCYGVDKLVKISLFKSCKYKHPLPQWKHPLPQWFSFCLDTFVHVVSRAQVRGEIITFQYICPLLTKNKQSFAQKGLYTGFSLVHKTIKLVFPFLLPTYVVRREVMFLQVSVC